MNEARYRLPIGFGNGHWKRQRAAVAILLAKAANISVAQSAPADRLAVVILDLSSVGGRPPRAAGAMMPAWSARRFSMQARRPPLAAPSPQRSLAQEVLTEDPFSRAVIVYRQSDLTE
jgi:hypothetical protein